MSPPIFDNVTKYEVYFFEGVPNLQNLPLFEPEFVAGT